MEIALCSDCFGDEGLRLDAQRIGIESSTPCPVCGSSSGMKLDRHRAWSLAHSFFVWGTMHRTDYGAAPVLQFNKHQKTSIAAPSWLEADLRLLEKSLRVGFFHYAPHLWMIGGVNPLEALQDPVRRDEVIRRIVGEYPAVQMSRNDSFYRIRRNPENPESPGEYDSPPTPGSGRLDSVDLPVLYGSQDLQVCLHECRVTAEDDLYLATFAPARDLRLLDLTELLWEEDVTEFDSLDMAVHMLFLAASHAYEITREIARGIRAAGYDGLVYPSYFSLLRTGAMPFETAYGISLRRVRRLAEHEKAKMIPNLALFGRPVKDSVVVVRGINRVVVHRVDYSVRFGPVGYDAEPWVSSRWTEERANP